jgi:hypothetical protein
VPAQAGDGEYLSSENCLSRIQILHLKSKWTALGVALSCLAGVSLRANPVTVDELGIGSHETVNITSSTLGTVNVYAGIINLEVNAHAAPFGGTSV